MEDILKNKWQKLDNMAKLFSLSNKKNTNIFRFTVILKQKVNKYILSLALNKTLITYPDFKVKLRTGMFWNYLEFNKKAPIINQDNNNNNWNNCISLKENNDYLFKITYYKNILNIDMLHVLTDGIGATYFVKELLYNYLNLKYRLKKIEKNKFVNKNPDIIKYKKKNTKFKLKNNKIYQITDKINSNINNTHNYIIKIDKIKEICKKYKTTVSEYLITTYIYALYKTKYNINSKKDIVIAVPINLRKYFKIDTLNNFFVCMNINCKTNTTLTFDNVLNQVKQEFKKKLNKIKIQKYLNRDICLGTNVIIRLIPLYVKKIFMNYLGNNFCKTSTSTLSNLGIIDIDKQYQKYIDNIYVKVKPVKTQKIKCTICSYNNYLNIVINSNIDDKKFQECFLKILKKDDLDIKLTR